MRTLTTRCWRPLRTRTSSCHCKSTPSSPRFSLIHDSVHRTTPTPSPTPKDAITSQSRPVNLPPQLSQQTTVPQAHPLIVPWARSTPHQVGLAVLRLRLNVLLPHPITDSCRPILVCQWVRPSLRRTLQSISTNSSRWMG